MGGAAETLTASGPVCLTPPVPRDIVTNDGCHSIRTFPMWITLRGMGIPFPDSLGKGASAGSAGERQGAEAVSGRARPLSEFSARWTRSGPGDPLPIDGPCEYCRLSSCRSTGRHQSPRRRGRGGDPATGAAVCRLEAEGSQTLMPSSWLCSQSSGLGTRMALPIIFICGGAGAHCDAGQSTPLGRRNVPVCDRRFNPLGE
jgi:hypothetical protein